MTQNLDDLTEDGKRKKKSISRRACDFKNFYLYFVKPHLPSIQTHLPRL